MNVGKPQRVHVADTLDSQDVEALSRHLGAGWTVSNGDTAPPDVDYLVAGCPEAGALDTPSLRALLIPYAGLLPPTRRAVLQRPHLPVYNLHHHAPVVAEFALTLLLSVARRVSCADRMLRLGAWDSPRGFTLRGRTVLIVGFGHVGRALAPILHALGCEVLATRRNTAGPLQAGNTRVHPAMDLHGLLPRTDVVVLAAPLTEKTRALIGERELDLLPQGAVLINVARGELVDEAALYARLASGALGGAGLDVWYRYPKSKTERSSMLPAEHPFWTLDTVVMSPHRAGRTEGGAQRRKDAIATLLGQLAAGEYVRPVDARLGY